MGLVMHYKDGKSYPVMTCDSCDKRIENWKLALVRFSSPTDGMNVPIEGIYHNGKCDPDNPHSDKYRQQERMCWMPLDQYLTWLLWNHKWGTKRKTEQGWELVISITPPDDL